MAEVNWIQLDENNVVISCNPHNPGMFDGQTYERTEEEWVRLGSIKQSDGSFILPEATRWQMTLSLEELREKRDDLLLKSDWTQLDNANLTTEKKAEWETYRQALRDMTDDYSEVKDLDAGTITRTCPDFPTKPS